MGPRGGGLVKAPRFIQLCHRDANDELAVERYQFEGIMQGLISRMGPGRFYQIVNALKPSLPGYHFDMQGDSLTVEEARGVVYYYDIFLQIRNEKDHHVS